MLTLLGRPGADSRSYRGPYNHLLTAMNNYEEIDREVEELSAKAKVLLDECE